MSYYDIFSYIEENSISDEALSGFMKSPKRKLLFGAGQQAVNCLYLFRQMNFIPDGILVSKCDNRIWENLPVYSTGEINDKKNVAVLLAINEKASLEVQKQLIDLGYEDIYCCSDWQAANQIVKQAICYEYYRKHQINIEKDLIHLGKCRFLNPFLQPQSYRQMMFGTTFSELIVPGILEDAENENAELYRMIKQELLKSKIVYDVGANVGIFAGYASALGNQVIAFEPSLTVEKYLRENSSYADDVTIETYAVCDSTGEADFFDYEDYPKYSTLLRQTGEEYKKYPVSTITLDEFVKKTGIEAQFLRIYVNGAALRVLQGAKDYIRICKPCILISLEQETEPLEMISLITALGGSYTMKQLPGWLFFYQSAGGQNEPN